MTEMLAYNQKVLSLILGLWLLLSCVADGAQIQSQAMKNGDNADGPTNAMLNKASTTGDDEEKEKEEKEDEKETDEDDEDNSHKAKDHVLNKVKKELAGNLHEQSALKHTLEDLTDEAESDEEIDEAAKQVANETESAAMGNMLGHMWKDMRMLELPAYSKYVKKKVHHLKHEESKLESKLTAAEGKVNGAHDDDEKEEGKDDVKNKEEEDDKEEDDDKDKKEEKDEDEKMTSKNEKTMAFVTPTVNFWRMTHNQQESVLISSWAYMVAGLLAAVLFKQVREKYFVLEPMGERSHSARDFSFSIFGCLAEPKLCVLAFCCPCLAWANTLDRNKGLLSYWPAFLCFFGMLVLEAYTMGIASLFVVGLGVYYRQKLREINDIDSCYSGKKSTLGLDILFWCFCQPCAIIQEAREESVNQKRMFSAAV